MFIARYIAAGETVDLRTTDIISNIIQTTLFTLKTRDGSISTFALHPSTSITLFNSTQRTFTPNQPEEMGDCAQVILARC